jgi:hypothetical protein
MSLAGRVLWRQRQCSVNRSEYRVKLCDSTRQKKAHGVMLLLNMKLGLKPQAQRVLAQLFSRVQVCCKQQCCCQQGVHLPGSSKRFCLAQLQGLSLRLVHLLHRFRLLSTVSVALCCSQAHSASASAKCEQDTLSTHPSRCPVASLPALVPFRGLLCTCQ